MPVFEYKGLNGDAKACVGVIDADTARDAREKLRLKKIYVTRISTVGEPQAQEAPKPGRTSRPPIKLGKLLSLEKLGQGRRNAEVSQFTRQLATLLSAGIPLAQSLTALVEQITERKVQTVIRDVREKISSGTSIADALAAHPLYFSSLYCSMVKAGEASGELATVLSRVGDFMQKQTRLRGKIMAAMTYPIILLIMSVLVVTFLMIFVVPNITSMLDEQGIPKPLPTMIVTGISDFLTSYWYIALGVVLGGMIAFKAWKSTERGRYKWDGMLLRAPLIGPVFTKVAVSRFATTLAVLLRSGLPALDGLRIVKDVVDNAVLQKVIGEVHDSIIEGTDISTPIKKSKVFPPVVGYMIAVGEQTGELGNLLERVAEAYDEEVDLSVQKMTAAVEPMMIVFMAVTVGTIIASVLMPLMKIAGEVR